MPAAMHAHSNAARSETLVTFLEENQIDQIGDFRDGKGEVKNPPTATI